MGKWDSSRFQITQYENGTYVHRKVPMYITVSALYHILPVFQCFSDHCNTKGGTYILLGGISRTGILHCASLLQINEEDLRELRLARSTRNLTMMDEHY